MEKNIMSAIGMLTVLSATSISAQAQTIGLNNQIRAGVFYDLTPSMANSLKIDLKGLRNQLKLNPEQKVLFKLDENGELDLSIYENSVFSQDRSDDELK